MTLPKESKNGTTTTTTTMLRRKEECSDSDDNLGDDKIRYWITGKAAHDRLVKLVPQDWIDVTGSSSSSSSSSRSQVDFLWENAPRIETRWIRESVKCYSHLPHGTNLLDSKWALVRLLDKEQNALESFCFRGLSGFWNFCRLANLDSSTISDTLDSKETFLDLLHPETLREGHRCTGGGGGGPNWWVLKDAHSNGAGGIWILDSKNISWIAQQVIARGDDHNVPPRKSPAYVAQRYAWPIILYGGRKCHVRVYALFTSDGRAFVHRKAFLHVANKPFLQPTVDSDNFEDSVHITNCCANSHDKLLFAGEICADFLSPLEQHTNVIGLDLFFPSIRDTVATLCQKASPFLQGGQVNGGFQYLGLDFILTYQDHDFHTSTAHRQFSAFLLEVNAPPSQDTATGLPHAEDLHNTVLFDLITLWVLPKVTGTHNEVPGGWQCVYNPTFQNCLPIEMTYHQAVSWNRLKWALAEQRALQKEARIYGNHGNSTTLPSVPHKENSLGRDIPSSNHMVGVDQESLDGWDRNELALAARGQFEYFRGSAVFLESAGGSQVPQQVVQRCAQSLSFRHRDVVGKKSSLAARQALLELVGLNNSQTPQPKYYVYLGANATILLNLLARSWVCSSDPQQPEIVIAAENHLAHVTPWLEWARENRALVKWWLPLSSSEAFVPDGESHSNHPKILTPVNILSSFHLAELITPQTRIVAVSHASNVLGELRDLKEIRQCVHKNSKGRALLVVDGVAAVPHVFANLADHDDDTHGSVDAYVISCHKVFGPHLGALFCRPAIVAKLSQPLEVGTVNFEACEGILGVVDYMKQVWSSVQPPPSSGSLEKNCCHGSICDFYRGVRKVEIPLTRCLLEGLTRSKKVRILQTSVANEISYWQRRLPVVCFCHESLSSSDIEMACLNAGFVCRSGTFLSTDLLLQQLLWKVSDGGRKEDGLVRFSLAHYNTLEEVQRLLDFLFSLQGWF